MFKRTRRQTGQLIETKRRIFTAILLYHGHRRAEKDYGQARRQVRHIRTRADVEHLIKKELAKANGQGSQPVKWSLEDFVEQKYLPWATDNKAAVTACSYKRLWLRWKIRSGRSRWMDCRRPRLPHILTAYAKEGYNGRTLSHIKWFLSGVV